MADDPTTGQPDSPQVRIERALFYAGEYGFTHGAHHKQWVIDQMCRALTGCPYETREAAWSPEPYAYQAQGESAAYQEFVGDDEDFDRDEWEGIAP